MPVDQLIGLPPDVGNGKQLHTRERTVTIASVARVVQDQYVIALPSIRRKKQRAAGATYRVPGAAALLQTIAALKLQAANTTEFVYVRSVQVHFDATTALAAVAPSIALYKSATEPTGGAVSPGIFPSQGLDESPGNGGPYSGGAVVLSPTSTDGGAITAITGDTIAPNSSIKRVMAPRWHTLVGFRNPEPQELCPQDGIILMGGQGITVRVEAAATTSNPATAHWMVSFEWEMYDIP